MQAQRVLAQFKVACGTRSLRRCQEDRNDASNVKGVGKQIARSHLLKGIGERMKSRRLRLLTQKTKKHIVLAHLQPTLVLTPYTSHSSRPRMHKMSKKLITWWRSSGVQVGEAQAGRSSWNVSLVCLSGNSVQITSLHSFAPTENQPSNLSFLNEFCF